MCKEFQDDSSYQGLGKLHYIQSNTNHRDVRSASARYNVDGQGHNSTERYFVAGDSGVSVGYNWSDSVEMGLLWVDYGSDRDSIFYNFRNNDILKIDLRYNFQI